MPCKASSHFPVSNDTYLQSQLNQTLWQMFSLNIPATDTAVFGDTSFLSSIYCSKDSATQCYGICPNADLAGVGVRAAFWTSSILQAILVAVSPEDSTQGAWTAAVLTASVILPAVIQKRQGNLSIYHATLVLNFATFASLVSLAVAPMCSVWREGPTEDDLHTLHTTNPSFEVAVYGEEGLTDPNREFLTNLPKRKVHRERLMLSLALLTQVALQWTWATALFTDQNYYQKACVPETIVLLFGYPLSVHDLNHDLFVLWPLWLLFNVSITLIWGTLLVYSSSPSVHPILSRQPSRPMEINLEGLLSFGQRPGHGAAFEFHSLSASCAIIEWSFGQIAALLVALVPAWPILAAVERRLNQSKRRSDDNPLRHDTESNLHNDLDTTTPLTPSQKTLTPFEKKTSIVFGEVDIEEIPVYSDTLAVSPRAPYPSHHEGLTLTGSI
ncbi:hypothetical protein CPB84DRAFT_1843977 [Gymnopilus junonius]|uniref:Uncharacterized protein n=1 Tax=Gymnopilus junonius TaxID=109634 RepID=A0A9P5TRF2_GYMJU|nr:hypothetical protein CPB84DRAFT_1843977 [Gymnopilus junonius]